MPLGGGYHASKWAPEALNESLAQEVAGFGIKVTLVEPSAFATRSGKPDPFTDGVQANSEPIYDGVRGGVRQRMTEFMTNENDTGDLAAAAWALLKIVDSDSPPLRVFFGHQGHQMIQQCYADRLKTWADWQDLSVEAYGSFDQDAGQRSARASWDLMHPHIIEMLTASRIQDLPSQAERHRRMVQVRRAEGGATRLGGHGRADTMALYSEPSAMVCGRTALCSSRADTRPRKNRHLAADVEGAAEFGGIILGC